MKYISKWYIASLAIAFCCLASACSPDEELAPVEVSFTAPGEFDMSALDSCESIINTFELTANGVWTLYSDKSWVKLSLERDGFYFNDLKGVAGTHTVYVKVTNEARDFNDSKATITLDADGKVQEVTTIHRKGIERSFVLMSDGKQIDRIEIGQKAEISIVPVSNFEYSLLAYPDWIIEPEKVDSCYKLKVQESLVPHPYVLEGTVTFGNIENGLIFDIDVEYKDAVSMVIVNGNGFEDSFTPWNWEASVDGKTFKQNNSSFADDSVETVVEDAFIYSVSCLNYEYKLVSTEINNGGKLVLMDADESWIIASKNESDSTQISVSVTPLTTISRQGYQFAVPVEQYNVFMDSLAASDDADAFVDKYLSYVLLQVQQSDNAGFLITDAAGLVMSSVVDMADSLALAQAEYFRSEFSIEDLTTCNLVPGESYTIDTKLKPSEWNGGFALEYIDDRSSVRLKNWGIDKDNNPVLGEDGLYKLNIVVPASLSREVILRLHSNNVNIKALIIRPVAQ